MGYVVKIILFYQNSEKIPKTNVKYVGILYAKTYKIRKYNEAGC
jgi:hypothetical protein